MKSEVDAFGGEERRHFTRALLADLRALEVMLAGDMLEEGVRRVGAEQELFLINSTWHPAPAALEMLQALDDPHFTTELGLFNLEFNLDPHSFKGGCLRHIEGELNALTLKARHAAASLGLDVILTGILPTLRQTDLGLENMTPNPRYLAINEAMNQLRGGVFDFYIKGLDELITSHDSIMVESCNASFQAHLQVDGSEFARMYNMAQALTAPVLAVSTNSPLLFGHRLWEETRIALFQQSIDTRSAANHPREAMSRVTFGNRWVRKSVLELFKEDVTRFRTLVGSPVEEDPMERLERGEVPELSALRLHNGTIYRWNRACYGITDGVPHVRIENRVMPSGPSIVDEVANAAFWFGLMQAMSTEYEDVTKLMEFEHAKLNFLAAARQGLAAQMIWFEGEELPVMTLLLERLIPMAHEGLRQAGVDLVDVDRYIGIVAHRVESKMSGSRWLLESLHAMKGRATSGHRFNALVAATLARQVEGLPVADWEPARLDEISSGRHNYFKVEQYMQTDVVSVQPDESIDLVANLMEWQRIRHVLVEDHEHRLVGLVSYRAVLRHFAHQNEGGPVAVTEIMNADPICISPQTPTTRAIQIMREHRIGCLPVVHADRVVGIVTERDFMDIAAELLEEKLEE